MAYWQPEVLCNIFPNYIILYFMRNSVYSMTFNISRIIQRVSCLINKTAPIITLIALGKRPALRTNQELFSKSSWPDRSFDNRLTNSFRRSDPPWCPGRDKPGSLHQHFDIIFIIYGTWRLHFFIKNHNYWIRFVDWKNVFFLILYFIFYIYVFTLQGALF